MLSLFEVFIVDVRREHVDFARPFVARDESEARLLAYRAATLTWHPIVENYACIVRKIGDVVLTNTADALQAVS